MTNNDEDTSRQAESLWRSDDWADLRWAREHSTPQQIASTCSTRSAEPRLQRVGRARGDDP